MHWLVGLYENGLNGILGDEMGLGKTVQSVALLAHLKEHNVAGPFMVVGPLSTLHNWKNEVRVRVRARVRANPNPNPHPHPHPHPHPNPNPHPNQFAKWAPSMDAVIYHGPEKERAEMRGQFLRGKGDADKKFPVLITSYEIVIRDARHLKRCGWKFVIIDEGARTHPALPMPHPSRAAARPRPCRALSPPRPATRRAHTRTLAHRGVRRPPAQEHELPAHQGAQGHLRRQPGAAVQPAAAHGHAAAEQPDRALVAAQLPTAEHLRRPRVLPG